MKGKERRKMTDFEERKQRLELFKLSCVCALLLLAILSQVFSCNASEKRDAKIIDYVAKIQLVMEQVAEKENVTCPITNAEQNE